MMANKVIGFYGDSENLNKFRMIMYNVEIFERHKKFDLDVEMITAEGIDIDPATVQEILNDKYHNEHKLLRCVLTIFQHNEDDQFGGLKVFSHLFVYQDLKLNYDSYDSSLGFIVVNMPKLDRKRDSTEAIELFLKEYRRSKGMYLLTIITNSKMKSSLMVFARREQQSSPKVKQVEGEANE